MELRHIRYFVRAAEMLHFTHAAESLYISQPTLSTHIQQLEEELDTQLFDRAGRHVRLTDAGEVYLEHAQKALRELDLAKDGIAELKGLDSGTVRLGALLTFGQEALPSWIASFHSQYPNIRINVQSGTSDALDLQLQSDNIDLLLSFVPASVEDAKFQTLFSEPVYLVVGESHPLADRKQIEIEELNSIPLAMVSRRWTARRLYDAFLTKHNVSPNIVIEIDDLHALMRIAAAGKAGVLITRLAAGTHTDLRLIEIAGSDLKIEYGVLWHKNTHLSRAARAFLDHIRRQIPA